MKIDIYCPDATHPVQQWLQQWEDAQKASHQIRRPTSQDKLTGGDILFLISCGEIIGKTVREHYQHVLVIHASDLPKGRGWSPHIWEILAGAQELTISLLTAEDAVDSGAIWAKERITLAPHMLYDEINEALFDAELALMDKAIAMISAGQQPTPQSEEQATYHPRRTPADSQLDPQKSLAEQFNQLRVADPERYPAFFELHGHRYHIKISKVKES